MTAAASVHSIRPLDPKFPKIIALLRSTQHAGEKAAARAKAESMAADAGMSLDEALMLDAEPKPTGFFEGFDDFCEKSEPGYKARRAAERLAKYRAWRLRKAAILARYGSQDAATAPCERERLILAAVAPWRTVQPTNSRWTHRLDGWGGEGYAYRMMPPHVLQAIKDAYPLPTTFAEAKAEHEYWEGRNRELEDVYAVDATPIGDIQLDTPCYVRAEIVRDLTEHDLPVTTLTDLHARFAMMRASEVGEDEMEAALFRDLGAMVERERDKVTTGKSGSDRPPLSVQPETPSVPPSPARGSERIAEILRVHADWTDRRIARAVGCSPTTVGKVRRAIGASCTSRSVQRNGRIYKFALADREVM